MNKKHWTAENITQQNGRIAIVTGSSSGIGYETAKVIAMKNAKVIIAVRNLVKGELAKSNIKSLNKRAEVEVMKLDLADLTSVKQFSNEFKNRYNRLDILINNAGVMIPPYSKTRDGFELQFGTNYLGHFALTIRLFDLILKTPGSRIVNVSSSAHKYGNINFDDLMWEKRKYIAWRAYGDSKIANLYFTRELSNKIESLESDLKVTSSHPGWTATELQRHSKPLEFLNHFFAMDQSKGALTTLRAAFDENVKNGDYFGPDGFKEMKGFPRKVNTNKLANDNEIAKRLWNVAEKLTSIKFDPNYSFHKKKSSENKTLQKKEDVKIIY